MQPNRSFVRKPPAVPASRPHNLRLSSLNVLFRLFLFGRIEVYFVKSTFSLLFFSFGEFVLSKSKSKSQNLTVHSTVRLEKGETRCGLVLKQFLCHNLKGWLRTDEW